MGFYVNPKDMSKEQWIDKNAHALSQDDDRNPDQDSMAICLIDNGIFSAAAIAFSQHEALALSDPRDNRPKKWFRASREALRPYYDR